MATRTIAAFTAAALLVSGCAPPTQPFLDDAIKQCHDGSSTACGQIPALQSEVQREKNEEGEKVAKGILLVLGAAAMGAAAVAVARSAPPPPPPVFIPPPPPFGFVPLPR